MNCHRRTQLLLALCGAAPLFGRPAQAQCSEQQLLSGAYASPFIAVVDGDTLAQGHSFLGVGGAVALFQRTTGGWIETGRIQGPMFFGFRVDLDGDRMAVGAGSTTHVFERGGRDWVETAVLTNSGSGIWEVVGLDGNTLVVGDAFDDTAASDAGAVQVYQYGVQGWQLAATLTASDAAADDWFGRGVAIEGDRIIVAAQGPSKGYVFERSGGVWSEVAILDPQDPALHRYSYFGFSQVSTADALVAFGSREGAYVFEEVGAGAWQLDEQIIPAGSLSGDDISVAFDDERLAVGAPYVDGAFVNEGAAYVYERIGGVWTQVLEGRPSDPGHIRQFGHWIDLQGDELFVSSWTAGVTGTAYVLDFVCSVATSFCTANTNSSGASARVAALGSTALTDDDLTLRAWQLPSGRFGYYLMSMSQDFVPLFGASQGNLCLGPPHIRFSSDVLNTGAGGEAELALDFATLPQNTMFQEGSTWNFQFWFRDQNPGQTSNTTDGASVTFQTSGDPSVQFPVTLHAIEEEATVVELTISLSQASTSDVAVPYVYGGSATELLDYRIESTNPLVIPAGFTHATLRVAIAEDGLIEGDESLTVTLQAPTQGVLGTADVLELTIMDDD